MLGVAMRTGTSQQVAPPQELYRNPINISVAGFIGSPGMNFMPARINGDVLRSKLGEMPLSDQLRRGLEGYDAAGRN